MTMRVNIPRLGAALVVLGAAWTATGYLLGHRLGTLAAALVASLGLLLIAAVDAGGTSA
jgi:hypothetical protein